jgi:iron complex transport system ATP-binding protein
MTAPAVAVEHVSVAFDGRRVVDDISFAVRAGERWAVMGRNGAGKSTLMRCIAGIEEHSQGTVKLAGRESSALGARERARVVAYVPQAQGRLIPFSVSEYVLMGRFAHQGLFALPSECDRDEVNAALALTDTAHLATRTMDTLSGGELQRALLAGAVAQRSSVLLLDEPTTFLDPRHQVSIQDALTRIHGQSDIASITITHDINFALHTCTHVLALLDGAARFCGPMSQFALRSSELLEHVYGIPFEAATTADGVRTVLIPRGAT